MTIAAFDHVAIPIADVEAMLAFYRGLGFDVRDAQAPLFYSAYFGTNKINFHAPLAWQSAKFALRAARRRCRAAATSVSSGLVPKTNWRPRWRRSTSRRK